MANADRLAKLYIKHQTNSNGKLLANVHENAAFQEVYDVHGTERMRHRLERKMEQVSHNYNGRTHLFQKLYYIQGLLLDDEVKLREAFHNANQQHETE